MAPILGAALLLLVGVEAANYTTLHTTAYGGTHQRVASQLQGTSSQINLDEMWK